MICLLDDDPSVLKGLSRLLRSVGLEERPFTDPEPFLDFIRSQCTPVAVLDICLPRITGLEVQMEMKKICPATRAIMITGKDDPAIRALALKQGAYSFFLKPFNNEEFLVSVEAALTSSG